MRAEISNDARRSTYSSASTRIALTLAQTATRDTSLLALLAEDAVLSDAARTSTQTTKGRPEEVDPLEVTPLEPPVAPAAAERRVVPQAVVSRQLANPFLAPDFSAARPSAAPARRLATWELLGPLFSSFERAGGEPRRAWRCPRRRRCRRRAAAR